MEISKGSEERSLYQTICLSPRSEISLCSFLNAFGFSFDPYVGFMKWVILTIASDAKLAPRDTRLKHECAKYLR